MKRHARYNHVLFWIIVAISINIPINHCWKCRIYLYTGEGYSGTEIGPFDVGQYEGYGIRSAKLYSAGYYCYARFKTWGCADTSTLKTTVTPPFGLSSDISLTFQQFATQCATVWAVATPNPTSSPSESTLSPSTSP
eukprot:398649_1